MFRKSFSQKAARVFEIMGYLLLIPAVLGLLISIAFIVLVPFILVPVVIGVILLVGYSKHSRGTLDEWKIIPLWIGTFIFNVLPVAVIFYQFLNNSEEFQNFDFGRNFSFFSLSFLLLFLWWILACSLSLTAIYSELTSRAKLT